ncbi:Dabb family protein [Nonomuraea sp. NPDC026600]|uniref:Dabb family protein n=1 Tax=Nonomuraea sp. NPDC026600 TaxID=3155363 RepID=UPI0033E06D98
MRLAHIVLIKPRDGATWRAEQIVDQLAALATDLGAGEVYAGSDVSAEPFGGGYTLGVTMGFPAETVRDGYLRDARHGKLARELSLTAESVLVVDLPIAAAKSNDETEGRQQA